MAESTLLGGRIYDSLRYLMKIGFEKIMGYPCSSLATKWKLQCIRPTTNTKRFRKFCVRLTHLGTNFAPISHQILHLEKKFPKVYLIRTPCFPANSCQSCPKNVKMACQQAVYEQSNPVRTEQSLRYCCQTSAKSALPVLSSFFSFWQNWQCFANVAGKGQSIKLISSCFPF